MKVRIKDLSPEGLRIKTTMDLASLQKRVAGGQQGTPGVVFSEAPNLDILINRASHGGLVTGSISGRYRQSCALCVDEVERELDIQADFMLRERPEGVLEDDPQYQDDVGVYHFTGDQVELDRVLEEVVILSLSLYWHPPLENERCAVCGRQFGEDEESSEKGTQKLGDLLRKAGLN